MRAWNNVKTALLLGSLIGLGRLVGHALGGPQRATVRLRPVRADGG